MHKHFENPFEVKTPEVLTSQEAAELFVDVFTDFGKVKDVGHTFIHGARGTGKSMMLRYLEPDVQIAAGNVNHIKELNYYAVHIPIKKAWSDLTEWNYLTGASYNAIAEHMMIVYICFKLFQSLSETIGKIQNVSIGKTEERFCRLLEMSGYTKREGDSVNEDNFFERLENIFEFEFRIIKNYLRQLAFKTPNSLPYQGPLFSYLDVLLPIVDELKTIDIIPDAPFFMLIDDADQLDEGMQKILNTWVSCRSTNTVCLKIATQLRYKTYRTLDNKLIETPHDFTNINIGTIYTRSGSKYLSRVKEIVEKRLSLHGIMQPVDAFFPENPKQVKKIDLIKEEIKESNLEGNGLGGFRTSDDITRYAVPIYMSRLSGKSKSSASYSYAGFKNLVDISSGVIRWFLDPAAKMYSDVFNISKARLKNVIDDNGVPKFIPDDIQNKIILEWSLEYMDSEFSTRKREERRDDLNVSKSEVGNYSDSKVCKLENLINSLGKVFRTRLLDENAKERKLLSILITDSIPADLEEVLELGFEWGYLQKSSIGSKEGLGRKPRYTLSRRLAPYYKLDPSGYAYSLSVTVDMLQLAIIDPDAFVRQRLSSKNDLLENESGTQINLELEL